MGTIRMTFGGLVATCVLVSASIGSEQASVGVFTGKVLNSDGTAAVAVDVAVFRDGGQRPADAAQLARGGARLAEVLAQTRTDEAGIYRVENIPPGNYYLAVGTVLGGESNSSGGMARPKIINKPTYFPENPTQSLLLIAGKESSVEVRLQSAPNSFRLSGRIIGKTVDGVGNPITRTLNNGVTPEQAALVRLVGPDENCQANASQPEKAINGGVAASGAFEVRDVPPGTYAICAKTAGNFQKFQRFENITVIDRNISGLRLEIMPPRGRG